MQVGTYVGRKVMRGPSYLKRQYSNVYSIYGSLSVWPDAGIKISPNFPVLAQKEIKVASFIKWHTSKPPKKIPNIRATLIWTFAAKNFRKLPNLTTLLLIVLARKGDSDLSTALPAFDRKLWSWHKGHKVHHCKLPRSQRINRFTKCSKDYNLFKTFFKWAILGLFFNSFSDFQQTTNLHSVSGAGIQTHNLRIMSLLV